MSLNSTPQPLPANEIRIATAANDDVSEYGMQSLLRLIQQELQMDVAFVSEFAEGQRVLRHVDAGPGGELLQPGSSKPIEDTLCQRVIDGRLPGLIPDLYALRTTMDLPELLLPIGAHLSVPVQRHDGRVYGMLCCFSFKPDPSVGEQHLKRMEMVAKLAGRLLDEADGGSLPR